MKVRNVFASLPPEVNYLARWGRGGNGTKMISNNFTTHNFPIRCHSQMTFSPDVVSCFTQKPLPAILGRNRENCQTFVLLKEKSQIRGNANHFGE